MRNAVALAIGDRFLGGVEAQVDLLSHVAGARPAHQRLDLARLFRLEIENPFFGLGAARLHGRLGRLIDSRKHACRLSGLPGVSESPKKNRETSAGCLVGAAGFEPATW